MAVRVGEPEARNLRTEQRCTQNKFANRDYHCSHWLDRAATPRQKARDLFALVGRSGVTVESIRELITVPPAIERILQL